LTFLRYKHGWMDGLAINL